MEDFKQGITNVAAGAIAGAVKTVLEMDCRGHAVHIAEQYNSRSQSLGGFVTHYLTCAACKGGKEDGK